MLFCGYFCEYYTWSWFFEFLISNWIVWWDFNCPLKIEFTYAAFLYFKFCDCLIVCYFCCLLLLFFFFIRIIVLNRIKSAWIEIVYDTVIWAYREYHTCFGFLSSLFCLSNILEFRFLLIVGYFVHAVGICWKFWDVLWLVSHGLLGGN